MLNRIMTSWEKLRSADGYLACGWLSPVVIHRLTYERKAVSGVIRDKSAVVGHQLTHEQNASVSGVHRDESSLNEANGKWQSNFKFTF